MALLEEKNFSKPTNNSIVEFEEFIDLNLYNHKSVKSNIFIYNLKGIIHCSVI